MVDAPKQEWREGWTACIGSEPFKVRLTRRWLPHVLPLTIQHGQVRNVYAVPEDAGERWEASCEMGLDKFAEGCPDWIIEIEGSRKAVQIWKRLCDKVSDELAGLTVQPQPRPRLERDELGAKIVRTDANAPSTITHGDPHGD